MALEILSKEELKKGNCYYGVSNGNYVIASWDGQQFLVARDNKDRIYDVHDTRHGQRQALDYSNRMGSGGFTPFK
jgi:hypothetical protein